MVVGALAFIDLLLVGKVVSAPALLDLLLVGFVIGTAVRSLFCAIVRVLCVPFPSSCFRRPHCCPIEMPAKPGLPVCKRHDDAARAKPGAGVRSKPRESRFARRGQRLPALPPSRRRAI